MKVTKPLVVKEVEISWEEAFWDLFIRCVQWFFIGIAFFLSLICSIFIFADSLARHVSPECIAQFVNS